MSVTSSEQPMEIKQEPVTEEASAEINMKLSVENLNEESSDCCTSPGEDVSQLSQGEKVAAGVTEVTKDSGFAGKNSESAEDLFNTFLYWRPPLPDISQDLELLQFKTEKHKDSCSGPCNNCVASSEIRKVLESLQEHMDDPDVQGETPTINHVFSEQVFSWPLQNHLLCFNWLGVLKVMRLYE